MPSSQDVPLSLIPKLTNTAILAALKAGSVLRRAFGTSFEISSKVGKHNLVTEYDKKVEALLIEGIHKQFPTHAFLGEETGFSGASGDTIQWIIDPIDGTVNFAHHIPFFCVSIAAAYRHEVLCGVIYSPMIEELFVAERGHGAFLNGAPLSVSSNTQLSDGFLATGFPYNVSENPERCIDQFTRMSKLGVPIRRLGSAALDLAYVAAGRFDAYWEVIINPWDYAAGMLLIEEAKGRVSDLSGGKIKELKPLGIVASNGFIHDQLVSHLQHHS